MPARHRQPAPTRRRPGPTTALRARLAVLAAAAGQLLRRVPVRRWRELRRPRALAGLALILALVAGGTGIALATGPGGASPSPIADDRASAYDRANRDYQRSASASPSSSASPSASTSAAPSVAPTTASPTPAAPKTTQPVAPKTTPATPKQTTRPATPAGCGNYSGNQLTACQLLPSFGFATSEMSALVPMWNNESSWNENAENPSSGAYGIPQALPGSKMATAGSDWQTNAATQIKWGLGYIRDRYGSPSDAWAFWQNNGWY